MTGVARITAVIRTVPDLAAAIAFYRDALGFRLVGEPERLDAAEADLLGATGVGARRSRLTLGAQSLHLLAFDTPGDPYPADSTSSDLWFQHCAIVVRDMEAAYERVRRFPIQPITQGGPQKLPPNTGRVRAFKFRDPFGHPLELLWFPEGVGDAAWHGPGAALFQGLDHTAIAVSDVAASADFYRGGLGFAPAGRSHNTGLAQSRLDDIAGDDVDVVSLTPAEAPPHLELLGYRTGHRRSLHSGPRDFAVTRTCATCRDLEAVVASLRNQGGTARARNGIWDSNPAVTFEDLDGHVWICMAVRRSDP